MMKSLQFRVARMVAGVALLFMPMLMPVAVHADPTVNTAGNACAGANLDLSDDGTSTGDCSPSAGTDVSSVLKDVINIFSLIVGAVSVIMIIIGGFRYITSGGESSNVSGAKNTLIYAIVGLVIVVFAQIIVQFVLAKTTNATLGS